VVRDPSRARVTGSLEQYASGFVAELARHATASRTDTLWGAAAGPDGRTSWN